MTAINSKLDMLTASMDFSKINSPATPIGANAATENERKGASSEIATKNKDRQCDGRYNDDSG